VLGVGVGDQACGETGDGRMLEPEEIMEELAGLFAQELRASIC
jgi:phosphopantothenoylcysteine decarboxylase/phosphopantothenate--cysteine ligase